MASENSKYADPIDMDAITKKIQKDLGDNAERYKKMPKSKLTPEERAKRGVIEMPNDSHLGEQTEEQKRFYENLYENRKKP